MKINNKAVVLGMLVDVVGSLTLGLLIIGILLGIYYSSQEIPVDEMETYMKNDIPSLFLMIAVGFYFTFLGGFVAGRVAKADEVLHASIVGIAGVLFLLFFWDEAPLGVNLIGVTFTIPVAMLGGKLSIRKSSQPPDEH